MILTIRPWARTKSAIFSPPRCDNACNLAPTHLTTPAHFQAGKSKIRQGRTWHVLDRQIKKEMTKIGLGFTRPTSIQARDGGPSMVGEGHADRRARSAPPTCICCLQHLGHLEYGHVADRQDGDHATIFRSIRGSETRSSMSPAIWAPHKSRAARRSARNSWR